MSCRSLPSPDDYLEGVRSGSLSWLARAITLVESTNAAHRRVAVNVLHRLAEDAGKPTPAGTHRIGVTGAPGAGKSTFLDVLGERLCDQGHRVGVLAVDPTSVISGGSVLGDKTRMNRLAANPSAFVRPSPSGSTRSGVTAATLEAILLLEWVGFDIVFVETVGAGQSTLGVADLTDSVLTLVTPGAGDDLQGIKRGLLEVTDVLVVNKADADVEAAARRTASDYDSALGLLRPSASGWRTPVLTASALEGSGVEEVWERLRAHRRALSAGGGWEERRGEQRVRWLWHLIEGSLLESFRSHSQLRAGLEEALAEVRAGNLFPSEAAADLVSSLISVN